MRTVPFIFMCASAPVLLARICKVGSMALGCRRCPRPCQGHSEESRSFDGASGEHQGEHWASLARLSESVYAEPTPHSEDVGQGDRPTSQRDWLLRRQPLAGQGLSHGAARERSDWCEAQGLFGVLGAAAIYAVVVATWKRRLYLHRCGSYFVLTRLG